MLLVDLILEGTFLVLCKVSFLDTLLCSFTFAILSLLFKILENLNVKLAAN
jgi:hypothetical protein